MFASTLLSFVLLGLPSYGSEPPAATSGVSADVAAKATPDLVEITLERKKNGRVEPMATGHVFDTGDVIRMRLNSHYLGFLYVMNQGTSGRFATVFPAAETGSDNRVLPDKQYLVPAVEEGWFEVQGPAGFDVLYFLLSPTALAAPTASSFVAPGPVSSMKPRCNDRIFRARGECMDDSAGPAALPKETELPAPLKPIAGEASRDIVFSKKKGDQTVAVAGPSAAPMLYTFRLAHN